MRWLLQLEALIGKNAGTFWRKKTVTLSLVIIPVVLVMSFWLIASSVHPESAAADAPLIEMIDEDLNTLEKCVFKDDDGVVIKDRKCTVLMFAPNDDVDVVDLMKTVASNSELEYGVDIIGKSTEQEIVEHIYDNLGEVQTTIVFQDPTVAKGQFDFDLKQGADFAYTFWKNETSKLEFLHVQRAIDELLISKMLGKNATLDITMKSFPTDFSIPIESKPDSSSVIPMTCAAFSVVGVTIWGFIFANVITTEKRQKLLALMRTMGLKEMSYWVSWFIYIFVFALISSGLITLVATQGYEVRVYTETDPSVIFLAFFAFQMSVGSLCLMFSSFTTQIKWVNLAYFGLFIAAVFTQFYLALGDIYLYDQMTETGNYITKWDQQTASDASFFKKSIFFLMPWFHHGKVFADIMMRTGFKGREKYWPNGTFKWGDLSKTFSATYKNDPYKPSSPMSGIMNEFILTFIYMMLAWYCGQVFCGSSGNSKKFWFFVDPVYWRLKTKQAEVVEGDTIGKLKIKSAREGSYVTHKLSKSFESCTAVKEMSLSMKNGRIFCLLGHNGAGKSTTINMLTGVLAPTHGEAFLFGHSLRDDLPTIQKMMGICPQHDILFSELTAAQHIKFWAKFKGVSRGKIKDLVKNSLRSVHLHKVADRMTGNFSGGMQRRLSVAISAIGDNKVIFLDEPTTGLDPLSRRKVWQAIEKMKQGRIVLLTTHLMEEADILGDEIAIMSNGRLRAIGSSLFLKSRFGAGHHVHLLAEPSQIPRLEIMARRSLPGADVVSSSAGNMTLSVPHSCVRQLPNFFKLLEHPDAAVAEWGVSNTTLEEVFLRLTQSSKQINQELDGKKKHFCRSCGVRPTEEVTLFTSSGIAVVTSDLVCLPCSQGEKPPSLESLQFGTNPDEVVIDMPTQSTDTMNPLLDHAKAAAQGAGRFRPKTNNEVSSLLTAPKSSEIPRSPSFWKMFVALIIKNWTLTDRARKTLMFKGSLLVIVTIMLSMLVATPKTPPYIDNNRIKYCPAGFNYNINSYDEADICNKTQFVETWMNSKYTMKHFDGVQSCDKPEFYVPDPRFGSDGTIRNSIEGTYPTSYTPQLWIGEHDDSHPTDWQWSANSCYEGFGAVDRVAQTDYNATEMMYESFNWTAQVGVQASTACKGLDIFKTADMKLPAFSDSDSAIKNLHEHSPDAAVDVLVSDFDTAHLKADIYGYFVGNVPLSSKYSYLYPEVGVSYMEDQKCGAIIPQSNDAYYFDPSMGPTIEDLYQLAPQALLRTVADDDRYYILATSRRGLSVKPNVFSQDHFLSYLMFPLMTLMFLPDLVSMLVTEKRDKMYHLMKMQGLKDVPYHCSNYVFHMFVAIVYSFLFIIVAKAAALVSFKDGSMVDYLITIIGWSHFQVGLAFLVSGLLLRSRIATLASYFITVVLAALCPVLAENVSSWNQALDIIPLTGFIRQSMILFEGKEGSIGELAVYQFIGGIILMILGMYLHAVVRVSVGQARHPLFFLKWIVACCRSKKKNEFKPSKKPGQDIDIRTEIIRVAQNANLPVRLMNLQKTFPGTKGQPPKHAVKGISFGLSYGECLGLLGPNGAGKTTTLDMLSGTTSMTAGVASICGCDVQDNINGVHKILGVCPQFDTVWPDMTTKEHLLLFARIKGVPSKEIHALAQSITEQVELDGDAMEQTAEHLSGGMKRRLSLGIALTGNPKVIFLDEPTTGLDPQTRQGVWRIINRARSGRCIILTTHSMEEADTLSTRIAIMANGEVSCIGSQQHLKNRYGDGYQLKIMMIKGQSPIPFQGFLSSICPASKLVHEFADQLTFMLPRGSAEISSLFGALTANASKYQVKEWGLNQTSLEEVFVKIVRDSQRDE